jgi:hypothetical protein
VEEARGTRLASSPHDAVVCDAPQGCVAHLVRKV